MHIHMRTDDWTYIGFHACSIATTHHVMYMHTASKTPPTLSSMITTAITIPTTDELLEPSEDPFDSSEDSSNSTITGDEKLPAPTVVTAWIWEYREE